MACCTICKLAGLDYHAHAGQLASIVHSHPGQATYGWQMTEQGQMHWSREKHFVCVMQGESSAVQDLRERFCLLCTTKRTSLSSERSVCHRCRNSALVEQGIALALKNTINIGPSVSPPGGGCRTASNTNSAGFCWFLDAQEEPGQECQA